VSFSSFNFSSPNKSAYMLDIKNHKYIIPERLKSRCGGHYEEELH